MAFTASGSALLGRDRELSLIAAGIDGLRNDAGGCLVVRGEPGVGKTALLATAAGRAADRGVTVLSVSGARSETTLPFAGSSSTPPAAAPPSP